LTGDVSSALKGVFTNLIYTLFMIERRDTTTGHENAGFNFPSVASDEFIFEPQVSIQRLSSKPHASKQVEPVFRSCRLLRLVNPIVKPAV